jgi:RNA polymerase sigma factor (sigma-70 family)
MLTKESKETKKTTKKSEKSIQEIGLAFYKERNDSSFTVMFNRLKPGLHKYLYDLVPDHSTRNAVIMNTFKNIWEKIDQYDPYYAFSTWAYRIARNEGLLSKRWSKKNYSLDSMTEMGITLSNNPDNMSTPDYEFFEPTDEEEIERLYRMVLSEIAELPEVYCLALTEREIKKKDYNTIAKELKWNINTVRTRIKKGRKLVFDSIMKKEPELVERYYITDLD